jgi:predicted AlkP superfamily pyrophosphatase or phosphodiesterase
MKLCFRTVLIVLLLAVLNCVNTSAEEAAESSKKYILFLTADGFRSDYVEWYAPPNIKRLIAEGVRVQHATNVFPTLTAPNMTSLVTGSYPRTTEIAANLQYVRERDEIVDHNRDNKAETIAETLHKAGWTTGAVNHFILEHRVDFYRATDYDDADATATSVLELLKNKKCRFVAAIFGATDHAGHKHGPRSDEVKDAVLQIDNAVGRLVQGLKEQSIYEQTLIVVNSDHGMSAFEMKQASIEPADALKQAGLHVATSQKEIKSDTEIVVVANGVRMIYFRQITKKQKERATKILSAIQGTEVLDREKLDALGCHNNRSGDLIVSPLPGYTMSNAGKNGGQHGRFAENNPLLFFRGPGFQKGATVDSARTIDVVPTLLRLVQINPAKTVEGRVIESALEKP